MPKIQKKNKIEQCTKIFIYRDLKITSWLRRRTKDASKNELNQTKNEI